MGLFSKIKNIFSKQEEIKEKINEEEIDNSEVSEELEEIKETEKYVEGLSKSRDNFVSKLSLLGIKYTKISDDFYDELEDIQQIKHDDYAGIEFWNVPNISEIMHIINMKD